MNYISQHITYNEATNSATATRKGIDNSPNMEQRFNMSLVADKVFEPVRNHFNVPIYINSFFRCAKLNKAVGGSRTSQHMEGMAIDMRGSNGVTNKMIFDYIKDNLEYDQLINEYNYRWVHVSFTTKRKNRKQILST